MSATSATTVASEKNPFPWSIVLSGLMILAGLLANAVPWAAAVAVNIWVGWLLVFSGAAHLVFAWHTRGTRAVVWKLFVGVLYLFTGGYVLVNPVLGLLSLTLALAIYLLVEGILEFVLSFLLWPLPGWGWLLFGGIVTVILAVMIWRLWPWQSEWVIGTLVGISMLFSGTARLMLSLAVFHSPSVT